MLAPPLIPVTTNFKATAWYTYDGDGLRQSKKTGSATKQYLTWTATGLPLLIDDTNNAYLYGPGGRAIAQVSTSDDVTYLHTDHLGSVRAITDSTAGVVGTASYSAYGEASTTGVVSSLAYAGQYTDSESGLQYLRARYYAPATGQFLTRDPIEDVTGDPYGYADGNPVMNTDPLGLFSIPGLEGDYEFAPSWSRFGQALYDTASGIANVVTFGATNRYQDALSNHTGCDVGANRNSWSYKTGSGAGTAATLLTGCGGASTARASTPFFGGRAFTNRQTFSGVAFGKYKVMLHQRHGVHLQIEGLTDDAIRIGTHR